MRSSKRLGKALLVAFVLQSSIPAHAGLLGKFKELYDNTSKAVENYNGNMWVGEGSMGGKTAANVKKIFKGEVKLKEIPAHLNQSFVDAVEAQKVAQDGAKADVTAILKTVWDIIMWLPRQIQKAFKWLMDKIRAFIAKLGAMNQGDTPGQRLGNLIGAGGGGGGGDAALADLGGMGGMDEGGADMGGADAGGADTFGADDINPSDLDGFLGDLGDGEALASKGSKDSSGLPSIRGVFNKMLGTTHKHLDKAKRTEAARRIHGLYFKALGMAFKSKSDGAIGALETEAAPIVATTSKKSLPKIVAKINALCTKIGTRASKSYSRNFERLAKGRMMSAN